MCTDRLALERLDVLRGQARRGAVAHAHSRLVEQQDRALHVRAELLDQADDGVEELGERSATRDAFENRALAPVEVLHPHSVPYYRSPRGSRVVVEKSLFDVVENLEVVQPQAHLYVGYRVWRWFVHHP